MRSDLFDEMYQLEARYWWHVVKRNLVLSLLRKYSAPKKDENKHLDIGCGTGKMLQEMQSIALPVGIDLSIKAISYCKKRKQTNLIAADLNNNLPIRSKSFEIVTMLDVLEHIENDKDILNEVYRILNLGGLFVVTVPAFPFLWTYWDDILGHKRRYKKNELIIKLNDSGFKIVKISYFYSFLFPVAILFRVTKSILGYKMKNNSDFVKLPSPVNNLLIYLSQIESRIVLAKNMPIGLSLVCICQKTRI